MDNEIEARAYQLEATNASLASSTLLVLPTAMGKTAVQWMTIAETLRSTNGMALLLAPTNALVDQQHRGLERVMNLPDGESIARMTGSIPPAKRKGSWEEHRIVVATPQVVRNDAKKGILDLSKVSILVVDEAHRATGNAAVAQVGDLLIEANEKATILGATASPGWNESAVEEVCERLHLEGIHVRGSDEPMLKPYASNLDVEEIRVPVPSEIRQMARPLDDWLEAIVARERRLGHYIRSGMTTMGGLNEAMRRVQSAIEREENMAYRSAGDLGMAIRLYTISNLLVCQGIAASREAIRRMRGRLNQKGKGERKLREFLEDQRIQNLENTLENMEEIHSKVSFSRRVIRQEIARNPEGRMIIFANYRDTVSAIVSFINDIPGINPTPFIGQANRGGNDGMSHSEQIKRLDAFRSGEYNVLVATSVGEEGLDIPRADLVLFYEPVGSEIRTIQRRGRTGRHDSGSVYVLIAQETRDEGATAAAARREEKMLIAIKRVKNKRHSFNPDLTMLSSFTVTQENNVMDASDFVALERERLREELEEKDETPVLEPESNDDEFPDIPPERRRKRGQSGLEEWY
ncbi:MAG: helicase-related protein [Candidatus Thalassarchaeaceae archaeon]|nr:helicase-related protein [Candidatus Thalassarchaeaceae archaeon]